MEVRVSEIYPEAGINFPISYKFQRILRTELNLLSPKFEIPFQAKHGKEYALGIILSAKSNLSTLLIKGPSISRKYKVVDYVLYIPFELMSDERSFIANYVRIVCEGIDDIIARYNNEGISAEKEVLDKLLIEKQSEYLESD